MERQPLPHPNPHSSSSLASSASASASAPAQEGFGRRLARQLRLHSRAWADQVI